MVQIVKKYMARSDIRQITSPGAMKTAQTCANACVQTRHVCTQKQRKRAVLGSETVSIRVVDLQVRPSQYNSASFSTNPEETTTLFGLTTLLVRFAAWKKHTDLVETHTCELQTVSREPARQCDSTRVSREATTSV